MEVGGRGGDGGGGDGGRTTAMMNVDVAGCAWAELEAVVLTVNAAPSEALAGTVRM